MMTAPAARTGSDEPPTNQSRIHRLASSPENHEVHAPSVGEPAASDIGDADGQPQRDWQVQSGQPLRVAAERRHFFMRAERKTEQRRHLDGQPRGSGRAQDDEDLGA